MEGWGRPYIDGVCHGDVGWVMWGGVGYLGMSGSWRSGVVFIIFIIIYKSTFILLYN